MAQYFAYSLSSSATLPPFLCLRFKPTDVKNGNGLTNFPNLYSQVEDGKSVSRFSKEVRVRVAKRRVVTGVRLELFATYLASLEFAASFSIRKSSPL